MAASPRPEYRAMSTSHTADYGPDGRVGVAVPHGNPTVEPELRALIPASIGVYATRLIHPSPRVEQRIDHYIRHMPDAIRSFGGMGLNAFGFGCTGSSYIAGLELEERLTVAASEECGVPVISAAQAIRLALTALGANKVALVSPYPENLAEAGYRYWDSAGICIVSKLRVDPALSDTHRIYELGSDDALAALRKIDRSGADCLLASGTGMPTLRALRVLHDESALPVISSNLCLAWALTRAVTPEQAPATPDLLLAQQSR